MPGLVALVPGLSPVQRTSMRVALAASRLYDNQRDRQLGDPFTAIASIVGGIFGASSQASAQKAAAKAQERAAEATANAAIQQAQIQSDAYRYATDAQMKAATTAAGLQFKAAKAKSDADLAAVQEQYGAALDALRQQRMAAIDQQGSQLIANTSAAIFTLTGQGLQSATTAATTPEKAGVAGLVLLAGLTFLMLNPPWGRKKKGERSRSLKIGGHAYESKHAYDVGGE